MNALEAAKQVELWQTILANRKNENLAVSIEDRVAQRVEMDKAQMQYNHAVHEYLRILREEVRPPVDAG